MKKTLSQALSEYAKNPNKENAKKVELLQKKFESMNYDQIETEEFKS